MASCQEDLLASSNNSGGTKRATSVNMPHLRLQSADATIHHFSRNQTRTQVLPQAWKLHVYRSGTFGAFWLVEEDWYLGNCRQALCIRNAVDTFC